MKTVKDFTWKPEMSVEALVDSFGSLGYQAIELNEAVKLLYLGKEEGKLVAILEKIQSIVGTFNVYDKQTKSYRPVEYRDIVILMRAPSATIADYIDILRRLQKIGAEVIFITPHFTRPAMMGMKSRARQVRRRVRELLIPSS